MAGQAELSILLTLRDEATAQLKHINEELKENKKQWEDNFGSIISNAKQVTIALGAIGAAITGSLIASAKEFADTSQEIHNMSVMTGMSTTTLSQLKYMADQTNVSFSTLQSTFRIMSSLITNASQGQSEASKTLRELGMSFNDFRGLSPDETFNKLASAIASVEDPIKRADLSTAVFGRTGLELLPIFAQGADGMQKMKDRARELGLVMGEDDVRAGVALSNSLKDAQEAVKGLMDAIGKALGPTLINLAGWFVDIVKSIGGFIDRHQNLVKAVAVIGAAFTGAALACAGLVAALSALLIISSMGIATPVIIAAIAGGVLAGGALTGLILTTQSSAPSYQSGGIVPGPTGQPVPIIAHGGERYLGSGGGAGNINLTINAGYVDNPQKFAFIMREELFKLMRTSRTTGIT